MQEYGNVLLSGAEKEAVGILSFDLITTMGGFAAEQPQLLANFVAVTAQMNTMWNAGEQRDAMLPVIAQDAGMDEAAAGKTIDDFLFLPVKTTLSDDWLGGRVGTYLDGAAAFFHDIGTVPTILPSYGALIDTASLDDVASR
jgi:taurine transport system substrate-binding protein